ncbi:MAG: glycosyltransferase [Thermoanaerobaculia bacterium]
MRLLCLTSRLPAPRDRGDRVRARGLLETFARDHRVTLLTACEDRTEVDRARGLEGIVERVCPVLLPRWLSLTAVASQAWRPLPLQALYYRSSRFRRALAALDPLSFDVIYLQLFRLAPYVFPLPAGPARPRRIVDLTDVVSGEIARSLPFRGPAGRWFWSREGRRIAAYEESLGRQADEIWVVAEAERKALLSRVPEAPVRVVPSGVDAAAFAPDGSLPVAGRLLFVGHLGVAHNADAARWLVEEILPRVRARRPEAHVRLVGASPSRTVTRLGRRTAVEVAGFVPELAEELRCAEVFMAPLRFCAGLQTKVLEAMAAARPVVTTAEVARGLDARPGTHLLVGDDAASLAERTLELLADRPLAAALGRAARRHVVERFSWETARRRLLELGETVPGRQRL